MLCSSEFSQIHKSYRTILLLMLSFQDTKHDCKIWFASNCIAFLMRLFCYWCNIHSSLNKNGSRSDWMLKLSFAVCRFLFGISWMPFVVSCWLFTFCCLVIHTYVSYNFQLFTFQAMVGRRLNRLNFAPLSIPWPLPPGPYLTWPLIHSSLCLWRRLL